MLIKPQLDPGNLGSIIRSAYFLGVDALAICRHTCAPLTSVALKASAGAAEAMPILSIGEPRSFLARTKENGWTVYACVTPVATTPTNATMSNNDDESRLSGLHSVSGSTLKYTAQHSRDPVDLPHPPLAKHPSILLLGGEGKGLKKSLSNHAAYCVSMNAAKRGSDIGVDSLNVSVAAAVVAAEFLRRPSEYELEVSKRISPGINHVKGQDGELGF